MTIKRRRNIANLQCGSAYTAVIGILRNIKISQTNIELPFISAATDAGSKTGIASTANGFGMHLFNKEISQAFCSKKQIITAGNGNPQADKLVYVYQTSSKGWYADTAPHILQNEGDRNHARLFGYFKTDPNGKFEFTTIKPTGYPNSNLPAHIHIEVYLDEDKTFISELLFDDDPRLVGETRSRSIKEKFLIVKNSGTDNNPLYYYNIQIPD